MKEKLTSTNTREKQAIDCLVQLLINKCENDIQLKECILNKENKNIDKCWNFIKYAMKQKALNGSYGATDDEVLGLAIHYYTEDNIEEPKQEVKAQTIVKPIKKEIKKTIKKEQTDKKKPIKKTIDNNTQQLSLFDFGIEI